MKQKSMLRCLVPIASVPYLPNLPAYFLEYICQQVLSFSVDKADVDPPSDPADPAESFQLFGPWMLLQNIPHGSKNK